MSDVEILMAIQCCIMHLIICILERVSDDSLELSVALHASIVPSYTALHIDLIRTSAICSKYSDQNRNAETQAQAEL